jgi:hypothetical protein
MFVISSCPEHSTYALELSSFLSQCFLLVLNLLLGPGWNQFLFHLDFYIGSLYSLFDILQHIMRLDVTFIECPMIAITCLIYGR